MPRLRCGTRLSAVAWMGSGTDSLSRSGHCNSADDAWRPAQAETHTLTAVDLGESNAQWLKPRI